MTRAFRLLGGVNSSPTGQPPPEPVTYHYDFAIILAALLCALVCVLGLVTVTRCACLRHLSVGFIGAPPSSAARLPPPTSSNKGLKKKILGSLPKFTFSPESSTQFSDCAICLTEFSVGEEIRVLPQCGHTFHVACIDTWFRSHSSCPSCRQILVAARCQKCVSRPPASSSAGTDVESRRKEREDDNNRTFLP